MQYSTKYPRNIRKKVRIVLLILAIAYLGWYIPIALGYEFRFHDPSIEGDNIKSFRYHTLLVFPALFMYTRIRFLGWLMLSIMVIATIYSFIGIQYGPPSIGIIQSVLNTNKEEAIEMCSGIPLKLFVLFALSIIAIAIYYINIAQQRNNLFFIIISLILIPLACIKGMFLKQFIQNVVYTTINYKKEINQIKLSSQITPHWDNLKISDNATLKNYIIIIGESSRADYASQYGYSLLTTPFQQKNSSIIFKNAVSPAANTLTSVPRILSVNSDQFHIINSYDAVTLAKAAGFETWWISSQGKSGSLETEIAQIASRSDHINYLQLGDWASKKVYDTELLPYLEKATNINKQNKKVIFLHLLGSHHKPCERLDNYPLMESLPNNWSQQLKCYITSIRQTDDFIAQVATVMKKSDMPYEIIYFSDHGVYIDNKIMMHSQATRESYHVPFIVIDSERKNKTIIPEYFDMRHFIDFFASEIGVKANQIEGTWEKNLHNSDTAITPLSWDKEHLIDLNTLESNPAITP